MKIKIFLLLVLLYPYFSCTETSLILSDSIDPDEIGTLNKDFNKEARELTIEPNTIELTFDGNHYVLPTKPGNGISSTEIKFEQIAGFYLTDYHYYSYYDYFLDISVSSQSNDLSIAFNCEKNEDKKSFSYSDDFALRMGVNYYEYMSLNQVPPPAGNPNLTYLMDIGLDFNETSREIRIVCRGNLYLKPKTPHPENPLIIWFNPAVTPLEQEAFPFEMILRANYNPSAIDCNVNLGE